MFPRSSATRQIKGSDALGFARSEIERVITLAAAQRSNNALNDKLNRFRDGYKYFELVDRGVFNSLSPENKEGYSNNTQRIIQELADDLTISVHPETGMPNQNRIGKLMVAKLLLQGIYKPEQEVAY